MKPDPFYKRLPKAALRRLAGPSGYGNVLAFAYRHLPGRACGNKVRFDHAGEVIRAYDPDSEFFFCVPERATRYIWPGGPLVITDRLWAKYISPDFQPVAGEVAIDVGANVGEFSIAAARRQLDVHAFEPDQAAYSALARNLGSYANARANFAGLGDQAAERVFYVATDMADSSFVQPDRFSATIKLKVIPLDAYVEEQGLRSIGLLKIEAEGFEPEVVAGARNALRMARYVSIDCGPERYGSDTFQECEAALREAGLHVERDRWILRGRRN